MHKKHHPTNPTIKGVKRKKSLLKTELVFDEKSRLDFIQNSQQRNTQRHINAQRASEKKRREAVRAFKAQTAQNIRNLYKEAVTYRNGSIASISRSQLCPETDEADASEPEGDISETASNVAPEMKTVVSDFYGKREQPVTISVTLMDPTSFSSSLTAASLDFRGSSDANVTTNTNQIVSKEHIGKPPTSHVKASGKPRFKKTRPKRNPRNFEKKSMKRTKSMGDRKR